MKHVIHDTAEAVGAAAAALGVASIRAAIAARGSATIVLATGASQFAMLDQLCRVETLDWSRVAVFHLDEYIGFSAQHPASFRRYLKERFLDRVPDLGVFHAIAGEAADLAGEVARLNAAIRGREIDVVFAGIGENGHLAFNDPPADFVNDDGFAIVGLDEACRRQQFGEGWFPSLEAVPDCAVTMTIRQILRGRRLILSVSDHRKAVAVRDALEGPLSPICPASILRTHADCHLFLDSAAASLLAATERHGSP
jgi:glucosamine-6-phosphate deaminase